MKRSTGNGGRTRLKLNGTPLYTRMAGGTMISGPWEPENLTSVVPLPQQDWVGGQETPN